MDHAGVGSGCFFLTILLGIGGAFVGGVLSTTIGLGSVTGFNLGSVAIATGGSLLLLWGHRRLKG